MYNTDSISLSQIHNHFLPKIAREYNITDESSNRKAPINDRQFDRCQPLISAGWFSTLFSNNRVDIHSNQETETLSNKRNNLLFLLSNRS